ncbi:3-dehydroquinate synthase [Bosea sp. Root483D1]|uniref:3-dehydroquinate synthase n=1 Tax=Bosea sp. Root483D1 TaxID=1736544 RepID=UPI000708BEE2|nr:3-dehydroquinate synthase [Bosea sp. Root483D1]KRE20779.1 3-dehydroquinate synthase [Bosea sp. Root483D1]
MTALAPAAAAADRIVVPVALAERSYDILIGRHQLCEAAETIARLSPGARAAIVTDENLATLHAPALESCLHRAGVTTTRLTVPPGEATKSYARFIELCDGLLAAKIERNDVVIALGGGVVGDLSGFAASVLRRGVRLVQIPTSLLAQVDSSVGGKTGINSSHGKNLIGAFHQPALVVCDTSLLDTLSEREFKAGYAEVVKYGLIDDPAFFDWCEVNWRRVMEGGPERDHAVATACRAKAAIVARDEREDGDRALLNLGHTFAHALERLTRYDSTRLVHGEAVAIGLCLAFRFSQRLGLCSGQDAGRVAAHLASVGLPTRLQDVPGGTGSAAEIVEAMTQDKKVRRGALTFILVHGIGKSFIAPGVAAEAAHDFIESELAGA